MKKITKHKLLFGALAAALPLFVVSCLYFDNISQPERALPGSEIEITAQLRVEPGTNDKGRLVFAMLVPKAWNAAETASLSVTTKDYSQNKNGDPEVVNEPLEPMPAGARTQPVTTLLPRHDGAWWYDFFTGEAFRGGERITRACGLTELPVYARGGSIVPTGAAKESVMAGPDTEPEIRVYTGADARFTLYDDAGDGRSLDAPRQRAHYADRAEHTAFETHVDRNAHRAVEFARQFYLFVHPGLNQRSVALFQRQFGARDREVRSRSVRRAYEQVDGRLGSAYGLDLYGFDSVVGEIFDPYARNDRQYQQQDNQFFHGLDCFYVDETGFSAL